MMFCPKCGSMLMPKKVDGKNVIICSCGYTNEKVENIELKEEIKNDKKIDVASEDEGTLPITEEECKKCGNDRAYYWLVQTRAGDEPETKFLKCTKCKHTWRDYS
ncbi:transcription factor S [Candidatus Woesearchaeota archaeon]|nr:transcription factor S [Candidatus Woesearchaeota archaeon]